jgi:hypothetical protein
MPDIAMCPSKDCVLKDTCYRNIASGTEPSEYRQSYFVNPPSKEDGSCDYYWNRT